MHANTLFLFIAAALSAIDASPIIMPKRMTLPVFYYPAAQGGTGIVTPQGAPVPAVDPIPSPIPAVDPIPSVAVDPIPSLAENPTAVPEPVLTSFAIPDVGPVQALELPAIALTPVSPAGPGVQARILARPLLPGLKPPSVAAVPTQGVAAAAPSAVPSLIQQIRAMTLPTSNQPLPSDQVMSVTGVQPRTGAIGQGLPPPPMTGTNGQGLPPITPMTGTNGQGLPPSTSANGVRPPMLVTPMTDTNGQGLPPASAAPNAPAIAQSLSPVSAPVLSVSAVKENAAALAAAEAAVAAAAQKAAADQLAAQKAAAAAAAAQKAAADQLAAQKAAAAAAAAQKAAADQLAAQKAAATAAAAQKAAADQLAAQKAAAAAAAAQKLAADQLAAQKAATANIAAMAKPAGLGTSSVAGAKYTIIRQNELCEGVTSRLANSGIYTQGMQASVAKCGDMCFRYKGGVCTHFVVIGTGTTARCHLHKSCATIGRSATASAVYKMG